MKKRFTEAQIIGFLKEAEAGVPVKELCRKHGFSDAAFYGWRTKFGGMQVSEAKRRRKLVMADRQVLQAPSAPNQIWSIDFIMDTLANGRRIKCLTIVDDFTRE